jgi:protocatechuate 3,4-dioxygenase beta subunit
MKKLKQCLYAVLLICCVAGCKKEDRTTVVFGKVTDDINQPIQGVEIQLAGEKGFFTSLTTPLKTVYTDAKGEYTITAEIPKDYHHGDVYGLETHF